MPAGQGNAAHAPQTEESPLSPPPALAARCRFGVRLLDWRQTPFDATVLRPTILYGLRSSHYGALFGLAAQSRDKFCLFADPDALMHSCHVDDCAEAYVLLAEHPNRQAVAGEAFNVANPHYETARQISEALAGTYGLEAEFKVWRDNGAAPAVHRLANFPQWVSAAKLSGLTGWTPRRPAFTECIDRYRYAYEAAVAGTD